MTPVSLGRARRKARRALKQVERTARAHEAARNTWIALALRVAVLEQAQEAGQAGEQDDRGGEK